MKATSKSGPAKPPPLVTVPITIDDNPSTRLLEQKLLSGDGAARDMAISFLNNLGPTIVDIWIEQARNRVGTSSIADIR